MANVDLTRIAGNIGALNSLNSLQQINSQLALHQTRLSTGKRINTAADDPAGLTIATKLNSRSEGLKTALDNIGDAKNLLAVAESGMGRINDILVQMRNKAETAASDTMGSDERDAIVTILKAFTAQIDDIAKQTQWNGNTLINGTYSSTGLSFQVGAGSTDTISQTLGNLSATGVGSLLMGSVTATGGTATLGAGTAGSALTPTTSGGANVATSPDLSLLSSGKYTVKLTNDAGGVFTTMQLLDSGGNALYFSNGAGGVTKSLTYVHTQQTAFDFGNGFSMTVADLAGANASNFQEVNFSAPGSYNIASNGATGTVLSGASSASDFRDYMDFIDSTMKTVSTQLTNVGATTGRLTFKEDQVSAAQINVESSYNRIMNANMAEEQVNASKFTILQQTATAMLAQANQAPQSLLSLFR